MDPETEKQISETVIEILKNSDMDKVTEYMVRKSASEKLDMDLSDPTRKKFVRSVVEEYLAGLEEGGGGEEEDDGDGKLKGEDEGEGDVELDDEGNPIICRLSSKRRVTISEFRGKTLVSIREYYNKGTKELPTAKGISLTSEQWGAFKKNVPAIEKAIEKMESRLD
ncbi:general transcription factor [Lithospermum erythrorhizon]|uniref:General transcription factor n=1 Tax=Lithospermum erythrorhizon TaxID=34254 RepID=A0AAV3QZN8_LITER